LRTSVYINPSNLESEEIASNYGIKTFIAMIIETYVEIMRFSPSVSVNYPINYPTLVAARAGAVG
jgi:hypothetical protein